jgi:SM-20-related protein
MPDSFENVIDALADRGLYIGPSILQTTLTHELHQRALTLCQSAQMQSARIGRDMNATLATAIRGDETRWLDEDPTDSAERDARRAVEVLRSALNRELYLGARTAELHFAHYAPGAFYKTHRDRFGDHDARVISLVFYLNPIWCEGDGGELVIYDEVKSQPLTLETTPEIARVLPLSGTMVAFRSERFPHEVLAASKDRFSLTGWLRRDG